MAKSMGASLYVPANHKYLMAVANGERIGHARSLIFCTEDSVADRDLSWALFNLSVVLANMQADSRAERFVRVRNPDVMARVLAMPGVEKLTGFVIPKATRHNFDAYFRQVRDTDHLLMPTLETAEVFNDDEMRAVSQAARGARRAQPHPGAAHRRQRPAGPARACAGRAP